MFSMFYNGEMPANPSYQEILKLDRMLTDANIPHTLSRSFDGWTVCYPTERRSDDCIMDAIEHSGSYGKEIDKLEIMGLLTPEEEERDSVLGYLTAEDVFERIRKHYNREWDEYVNGLAKKTSEEDAEEDDISESSDNRIMTPEEFAKKMKKISDNLKYQNDAYYDEEDAHMQMDDLMSDLLRQLGYGEGIDIFDNTSKWHA